MVFCMKYYMKFDLLQFKSVLPKIRAVEVDEMGRERGPRLT